MTIQTEIFKSRIHFANTIMKKRIKIKVEQNLQYNLTTLKKNVAFDILNDIIKDVTLVQLMESPGNVNHDISIVGYWIFDSNYKKALCLTQESLDIIRSPPIGKELVAMFQFVFYDVRYSWAPGNLKEG